MLPRGRNVVSSFKFNHRGTETQRKSKSCNSEEAAEKSICFGMFQVIALSALLCASVSLWLVFELASADTIQMLEGADEDVAVGDRQRGVGALAVQRVDGQ